jgi:glutamyl-tRNA synthetase
MLREELKKSKYSESTFSDEYLVLIINAMRERVSFISEFVEKCPYFYERPTDYDEAIIKKRWKDDSVELLTEYIAKLKEVDNPKKEDYEKILVEIAEAREIGKGRLIHPLRLAVSGVGIGPGVYDLLFILGKDEVINRIETALTKIKK